MKSISLVLAILFSNATVAIGATNDVLHTREFKLKSRNVTAHVKVRKTGIVTGMPYTIELRVNCDGKRTVDFNAMIAADSKTVCDVKPKSLKLRADGQSVGVIIREVDSDAYNEQTSKLSPAEVGELVPTCKPQSTEMVFDIADHCK